MFLFKHFFTRATDNVVVYLLWIREMLLCSRWESVFPHSLYALSLSAAAYIYQHFVDETSHFAADLETLN